jgi:hypothetical protein
MPFRPQMIFESPSIVTVLRENGLDTLDAIFGRQRGAHVRHVGRAVWQTELRGTRGETFATYFKLSWGRRRWWPRMSDIRTGQVLQSLAVREWEGLSVFRRLRLQVPERLALLEEGLLWKRSALILKAVPPPASISDMILDGSWLRLPLEDRHMILEELAQALCRMHRGGWAWRSISTRHVFPQRNGSGGWQLWFIDLEGVHRAGVGKALQRDFRRFVRALAHDRADELTMQFAETIRSQLGSFADYSAGPIIGGTKQGQSAA